MTRPPAPEVLRQHEPSLRRLPQVSAVGLGETENGKEAIVVFVGQGEDLEAVRAEVPGELDGYPVEVRPEVKVFPSQED